MRRDLKTSINMVSENTMSYHENTGCVSEIDREVPVDLDRKKTADRMYNLALSNIKEYTRYVAINREGIIG